MTAFPRFELVSSTHAIERCGVTIAFSEGFPEKPYKRARDRSLSALQKAGLRQINNSASAVNIDLMTGKISQSKGNFGFPIVFSSADQSTQLAITPNNISWITTRYVRWLPFIGQFQTCCAPLLREFSEFLPMSFVSLDYWDRFFWSGDWDDFDVYSLLNKKSQLLAGGVSGFDREWHAHTGWFSSQGQLRRLTNVNIDVGESINPIGDKRPTVGIYTSLRDEPNAPGYPPTPQEVIDEAYIFSLFDDLHLASKHTIAQVIGQEMALRINLFSRGDT